MLNQYPTRKRGFIILTMIIALLLVTTMACNLLGFLGGDDEPQDEEPVAEQPVEEEEPIDIEEPQQEEPEQEQPVQEEVEQEEAQEPVQEQPATELSGDMLYVLEGKQAVVKQENYTYGVFVTANPRSDCMYDYASYGYVAYDAAGNELFTEDSGYLETVLPGGQTVEIIYFPDEAQSADRFMVTLDPGECKPAPAAADALSISNAVFFDDEYSPIATALLNNNLDDYQTDIFVGALAYDAAGQIVGFGSSYINQIFPSDYTGVDIYMYLAEGAQVASVEFLPTHSYFTEIGMDTSFFNTAYLSDQLPWLQIEDSYETVFYIINDDPVNAAIDIEYRLTIVDVDNNVLSVESGWIDYVLPGDVSPVYISAMLPDGAIAATHFVELSPGEFGESPFANNPFTTANWQIDDSGWSPLVTFDLTNGSDKAVSDLEMIVILYDADENFIGGGYSSSGILSANGTVGQEVYVNVLGEAATVDVYLNIDYWTEIEGWGDN